MLEAIAAPAIPISGTDTSANCSANFTATAISIATAARFALPMPVRQAAKVSTPASVTAETEESRTRRIRSAVSSAEREEYKSATIGFARKNNPIAQGTASASVSVSAKKARFTAPCSSPRAMAEETAGTVAAANP